MPEQPMSKSEESLRALNLLENAKCNENSVKDATDKGVCALAQSRKFSEMARLSRFAEELGSKFLSTLGEDRFKTKDPLKHLKILEKEMPDWKEIMKRFEKAKEYEVKPKSGDTPAMIIFKYADGKTEEYHLELSFRHQSALAEGIAAPLKKMAGKQEEQKAEDSVTDFAPQASMNFEKNFTIIATDILNNLANNPVNMTTLKQRENFAENLRSIMAESANQMKLPFEEQEAQPDWNSERLKQLERQTEDRQNMRKREK